MRRAYWDIGWLVHEGVFAGISLGYDRCAEHEWGIDDLSRAFGLPNKERPVGLIDRTVTAVPSEVFLKDYTQKSNDKRRKGYPAALLVVFSSSYDAEKMEDIDPADFASRETYFQNHPGEKFYEEGKHDVVCAWSSRSFAVRVRGADNIEKLKQFHAALLQKDIAIGMPWQNAFFRGGLSLAIASKVPESELKAIEARDLANKELLEAVDSTGIREELAAAGVRFYAFSPDWIDPENHARGLKFFVNPSDQRRVNHGWFTLEEVRQCIKGQGVMMIDPKLQEFKNAYRDFGYQLVGKMKEQGLYLRCHEVLTWCDAKKTVMGARLIMSPKSESAMPSGVYSVEELNKRFHGLLEAAATPEKVAA